jgi:hypothetical protein
VPWIVAGAGAATLVGAGVYELLRRDAEQDAEDAESQWEAHDQFERMSSHQKTARVLAGVGALLVVGGGVLAVVNGSRESDHAAPATPVALGCDGSACVGTWSGRF